MLTPVGLLPIALAGFDIEALLQGARDTALLYSSTEQPLETPAVRYAVTRQAASWECAVGEVLVAFEPRLSALGQWWMQLFGESEGKEGKGLLPLSLTYTTDRHSMGQWIQQGPVSYTHLDVYKRQGMYRSGSIELLKLPYLLPIAAYSAGEMTL